MPSGIYKHLKGIYRHTEEIRKKISQSHMGKHHSEETKRKISGNNQGNKHPQWKGGRIKHNGYILIHNPNHPFANSLGYIREHRLIIEKTIGRYLHKWEICHHINGIKDDNRKENLVLCKSIKEHLREHKNVR